MKQRFTETIVFRVDEGSKRNVKLLSQKLQVDDSDLLRDALAEFFGKRLSLLQSNGNP